MSLKVTGVYFSASSAGPGPGKMKATIRAARQPHHHHHLASPSSTPTHPSYPQNQQQQQSTTDGQTPTTNGRLIMAPSPSHHHHVHSSQSLDYLHLNFEEKRQIIASSLSLVDFLQHPSQAVVSNSAKPAKLKVKGIHSSFWVFIMRSPPFSLSKSPTFHPKIHLRHRVKNQVRPLTCMSEECSHTQKKVNACFISFAWIVEPPFFSNVIGNPSERKTRMLSSKKEYFFQKRKEGVNDILGYQSLV